MSSRVLVILIAVVTVAADVCVVVTKLLPPAWALVVLALTGGFVALSRTLHNVQEGVSLKAYLTSPSAWAAAITIVASIVSALAGVVPPTYAAGLVLFAAAALRLARLLQTVLQPVSGVIPVASPGGLGTSTVPSAAAQAKVSALPSRGPVNPSNLGVLVFLGASLLASAALAQVSPTLGHCLATNPDGTCRAVVQPDVVKPVLDINLKTGKVAGGLDVQALGACYGLTYQPTAWYASGLDLCLNITGSQTAPTMIYPTGTLHLINYVSVTAGPQCLDGTCQWHLLLGGNLALDFGSGTAVQQRAAAKAASAGK